MIEEPGTELVPLNQTREPGVVVPEAPRSKDTEDPTADLPAENHGSAGRPGMSVQPTERTRVNLARERRVIE